MESAFTFIPRYVVEGISDWSEAFSEQISRIQEQLDIAQCNYKHSQDVTDKRDVENCEKWLTAVKLARSLYRDENLHPTEICTRLLTQSIDWDFVGSEYLLEALENDDFEAMIDW